MQTVTSPKFYSSCIKERLPFALATTGQVVTQKIVITNCNPVGKKNVEVADAKGSRPRMNHCFYCSVGGGGGRGHTAPPPSHVHLMAVIIAGVLHASRMHSICSIILAALIFLEITSL